MKVSGLKKDKLLHKCELLMVKGVDSPTDVSEQLDVSYNTAKSYISIVEERWQNSHTIEELQAKRKELIKKTEAIVAESWQLKSEAKNTQEATGALRTALVAIERLQKLHGIDSIPPQPEKPRELKMAELAHQINTTLTPESKRMVIASVRKAIKITEATNSTKQSQKF